MKQLIQSYRTGEMKICEVPKPLCKDEGIVAKTATSVVSAGTDKMLIDLAKKSLLGKAKARPDLVKEVLEKMKQEGIIQTLQKVFTKLDNPMNLFYLKTQPLYHKQFSFYVIILSLRKNMDKMVESLS